MEYNELYHHGIKGQKWGVRRFQNEDGSLTESGKHRYNDNYSYQQRIRDSKLYGKGSVKRINKRMNSGESISSARHNEVVRKERTVKAKKMAKTIGIAGVSVGGALLASHFIAKSGYLDDSIKSVVSESAVNIGKRFVHTLFD